MRISIKIGEEWVGHDKIEAVIIQPDDDKDRCAITVAQDEGKDNLIAVIDVTEIVEEMMVDQVATEMVGIYRAARFN